MKTNLPITQHELMLEPGKPIVTKTDLKGIITYANDPFVEISGFSREELIGKNHNVVRHPDMPPEAFEDLWKTIKADQPWRGLVKNRAKSGDFYWVEAYVTPITENNKTVGYMSVRSQPNRAEVQAAEKLYAAIRAKQAALPATHIHTPRISFDQTALIFSIVLMALALTSPLLPAWGQWSMVAAVAFVVGAFAAWLITGVARPLNQSNDMIRLMGEGKFNFQFDNRHQFRLGHLPLRLHSLRVHLRANFADVLGNSRRLRAEATRIDNEIQQVAEGARHQAAHVDAISTALEQLSGSSIEISHQAETAYGLAANTNKEVADGQEQMRLTRQRVDQAVEVVNSLRERLDRLNGSVQKIDQISSTISEIAEQTNLLALNAAIEAARAGEQGRGFAVVADEVRKLAERTSVCTADISSTLTAMQQEAVSALTTVEQAVGEMHDSHDQMDHCGESLTRIVEASESASKASAEILDMVKQQAAVSEEVAQSLGSVRNDIQQMSHNADNVSDVAKALARLAESQYELVRYLENGLD